jgi:hypothetical protein
LLSVIGVAELLLSTQEQIIARTFMSTRVLSLRRLPLFRHQLRHRALLGRYVETQNLP